MVKEKGGIQGKMVITDKSMAEKKNAQIGVKKKRVVRSI